MFSSGMAAQFVWAFLTLRLGYARVFLQVMQYDYSAPLGVNSPLFSPHPFQEAGFPSGMPQTLKSVSKVLTPDTSESEFSVHTAGIRFKQGALQLETPRLPRLRVFCA